MDGTTVRFTERLAAPAGAWAFTVLLAGTLAVAYGYALGPLGGILTFIAAQGLGAWVLLATAPVVRVDEVVLRAGRARLPRQHIGRVSALDQPTARRLRGVDADVRAYLCVRSWVPRAVLVEVTDPDDPHPYWLVSTRHPDRVLAALRPDPGSDDGPALAQ
jgi:hypothetical protein